MTEKRHEEAFWGLMWKVGTWLRVCKTEQYTLDRKTNWPRITCNRPGFKTKSFPEETRMVVHLNFRFVYFTTHTTPQFL